MPVCVRPAVNRVLLLQRSLPDIFFGVRVATVLKAVHANLEGAAVLG